MLLSIQNRLLITQILPIKDSFDKLILRKDVVSKVEFTQSELDKFKIVTEGSQVKWEKGGMVDVAFSDAEKNYVSEQLKGLSDKKELSIQLVELYEAFVNDKEPKAINDLKKVKNSTPEL